MINPKDIEAMGSLNMGERQMLGLSEPWESLTNIRLKQDGNYTYWKPRGGTVDKGLSTESHKYGKFFKARVEGDVNEYLARQCSDGTMKVYEYDGWSLVKSISGFTTDGKVEVIPIGELVYFFDGNQSKYLNLRTENVHDYLGARSGDITDADTVDTDGLETFFGLSEGDRAIVFPPELDSFNSTGDDDNYGYVVNPSSRSDYDVDYQYTRSEIENMSFNSGDDVYVYKGTTKGNVYKYIKGSSGILEESEGIEENTGGLDDGDHVYFSVEVSRSLMWKVDPSGFSLPVVERVTGIGADVLEFQYNRLANVVNFDGELYAVTQEDGQKIAVSDPLWNVIGYDETLEGFIGGSRYTSTTYEYTISSANDRTNPETAEISFYEDNGNPLFGDSALDDKKYYRQYVIVDLLDDGSVCIPGKPAAISLSPRSYDVGASITVSSAPANVAKRYLCATRFEPSERDIYRPSYEDFPNSPYFIAREISKSETNIFDGTPEELLLRPITEVLPMAAGIPTVFGKDQLTPQSVSPHKDIFVIGGYKINRPTPNTYTSFPTSDGNIYIDQSGIDTSNTAHFVFEYTDGTFSIDDSFTIKDDGCEAVIHSLNTLVAKVHLYVDDGTDKYKIDSFTQSDPEFMGLPFEVPTTFEGYSTFSLPDDIQESVTLNNYVTVPVPPQQIYIGAQGKVFGNSDITKTIPLDYDADKSTLRYRLLVFTEDNIQTGYISEVPSEGSNIQYNVNFEVSDESRRALKPESIFRIGGSIFFQDSNGIHAISGGQADKVIPKEQYDFLSNDLTAVTYNEAEDELWFLFGGSKAYVMDTDDGYRSVYEFNGCSVVDAQWFDDHLILLTSDKVCEGDKASTTKDLGNNIACTATSRYLSDHRLQLLLHEVLAYGIGGNVNLLIDDGSGRFEKNGSNPSDFEFASSQNFSQLSSEMYGALFTPRVRGIRPRIQLELTGEFQIEDIEIKTSTLANEGVARLEP